MPAHSNSSLSLLFVERQHIVLRVGGLGLSLNCEWESCRIRHILESRRAHGLRAIGHSIMAREPTSANTPSCPHGIRDHRTDAVGT